MESLGGNTHVQESSEVTLHIPIRPIATQSVRSTKSGHQYQPARIVKFKRDVGLAAKAQLGGKWQPLLGEVWLDIELDFAIPKCAKKPLKIAVLKEKRKVAMLNRPDADNCTKGIFDALNGIVYADDCQIRRYTTQKNYAETDSITITIYDKEFTNAV